MPLRFEPGTPDAYLTPLTIRHLLNSAIVSASGQQIVYRDQLRLSYAEFRKRISRLASALTGLGVEQGTTVAILDWDSHRYLESYFAVPMMGAVLLTANIRLATAQLLYTLQHAHAEILLVHRDFLPLVDEMRSELPHLRAVVIIDDGIDGPMPAWGVGEYEALLTDADESFAFHDFDENAVATTFYTTGTTGLPKGVCFTHRQLVLHALAFNAPFGVTRDRGFGIDDVYMPLTPMFHVHAWGYPFIATMLGIKQVYPGRYDPDLLLDLKQREGVTFSHGVPTILQMLLTAAERRGERLDDWLMVVGGSALSRDLAAAAQAQGMSLLAGYGMSETGPVIGFARRSLPSERTQDEWAHIRSGVPIPLVAARVVDQQMAELPTDDRAQGELVVRAPWLTPCYTGDEQASRNLWADGWLHTQDIASIAPSGSIQIRDRLKDVIKSGGEWICSLGLEELILTHAAVAEVAVVGVPDPKWQERPAAMVVKALGQDVTLDGINALLKQAVKKGAISRWAMLDRIIVADQLPKTSVGKIDKKAIRLAFAPIPA